MGLHCSPGDEPPREEEQFAENVASAECGAVVLSQAATVRSPSSLLKEGPETSMLIDVRTSDGLLPPNATAQHHVIVKLCRTLRLARIELANEERFSSRVRRVVIWARREQGWPWERLVDVELEDRLGRHSLPIAPSRREFGEVMLRILSHYGQQYYVALTRLVVEGLDAEEDDDDDEPEPLLIPPPGMLEVPAAQVADVGTVLLTLQREIESLKLRVKRLEEKR